MIDELFLPLAPGAFLRHHYQKIPYAAQGTASALLPLATPATLERLAALDSDLLVAREGALWNDGARPAPEAIASLFAEGWTFLIRHAERHDEAIRRLASAFEEAFALPADAHLYRTPAGRRGFAWHCDVEEVFVIQTEGRKEYTLRRNTTWPWPLADAMPQAGLAARETSPPLHCRLAPGDLLYIPAGWWHEARAVEDATSIAIGLRAPSGLEIVHWLARDLAGSLVWRRRLPFAGRLGGASRAELLAAHRALFAELARDLAARLADPGAAERFLAERG